jgi:hypothetical protein
MKLCVVRIKVLACVLFQMSIVAAAVMYTVEIITLSYLTDTNIPKSARPV